MVSIGRTLKERLAGVSFAIFLLLTTAVVTRGQSIKVDVTLPAADGDAVRLTPTTDARLQVVCFLGCECPLAKIYAGRLNELSEQFAGDEVRFIGINSNPQDSMTELADFASSHQIAFPLLKDHDGGVAGKFAASRTPEVFVIDPLGNVIYRGRIDDQYRPGISQAAPTRDDLRIAIQQFLDGQRITVPITTAAGCLIAKSRPVDGACDITYCGMIAEVLNRNCVQCHRDGEIGPFALTDYDEVVGWGDMMVEVISQHRMPPWHATSTHASFINERRMSSADRDAIQQWVDGGMPYGDAAQLPVFTYPATAWQFDHEPDIVLDVTSTPFSIAAGGVIDYQYFVVDPHFETDVWVASAEVLPGNRSVLHHAIAFIRPPDGTPLEGLAMLTAYVPGQRIAPVQPGLARRIPKGAKIVFQMHYTPTGTPQTDSSKLGLVFADAKSVTHELISVASINQELEIQPNDAAATVHGHTNRFPKKASLISIAPHMHLRGKSVSISIDRNGQPETILDVPDYDFNWQHTYMLRDPIPLRDGDSLDFKIVYDNSPANPTNPDATQFVTWGDQTFEEMAVVFYELSRPLRIDEAVASAATTSSSDPIAVDPDKDAVSAADDFMKSLDRNGDGIVQYDETDLIVRWRTFNQIDSNGDRRIDRDEAIRFWSQPWVKKIGR